METQLLALKLGWIGMLPGVISGAIMGLLFHRENWLGGYAAHARRFVRLGHPLYHRLTEEGRILVEDASEKCTLFDINFQPDSMSVEELRSGYLKLLTKIHDEEFVAERYRNFRGHLRQQIKNRRTSA